MITKSNIAVIRADIEAALKGIYAKHGVDITVGRITYNAERFSCKMEGHVRTAGATVAVDPKTAALKKAAYLLPATFDETKTYKIGGLGSVQIVGYNGRARHYPWIVKQMSTGKRFKFTTGSVVLAIQNGPVA